MPRTISSINSNRIVLQIVVNIMYYALFSIFYKNIGLSYSVYGLSNIFNYILVTISIPLLLITTSYILRSVILGLFNTVVLTYIIKPDIITEPVSLIQYLTLILFSLMATSILFRLIKYDDVFMEYLKSPMEIGPINRDELINSLSNYALLYASSSLSILVISYILYTVFVELIGVREEQYLGLLLMFLPVNLLLSMAIILYIRKPLIGIYLGLLSSLGPWSTVSIISYILSRQTLVSPGKSILSSRVITELDKGLFLGNIKAVLVYGKPSKLYRELKQEPFIERYKTWFWHEYHGLLAIDPYRLPNKHVVIMGSSGSGKSLLAKYLLLEYYLKFNHLFLVFDPHNEYGILKKYIKDIEIYDASRIALNPLQLGRLNPRERAHQLSSIIMSLFRLGHLQRQAIEDLLISTYEFKGIYMDSPNTWSNPPPNMGDVLENCRKLMEDNELYRRIYPYIRILADNIFLSSATSIGLENILSKPSIIVLNNLRSDYVRLLYVDTFLQRLLDMMYRKEIKHEYLIVLDEAYTLFTRDYSRNIASRLLMESRKYGLGIVFITQHPLTIPEPVVENASIKISFNISEPRNLDYVARIFSGIYLKDRINIIKTALKNLKSLNYILSITGLNDIVIVDEEEIANLILREGGRIVGPRRGSERRVS